MIEEQDCTVQAARAELAKSSAHIPLLGLGQTLFWDEPMKAFVAAEFGDRPFLAGVHDTDYFSRRGASAKSGGYEALRHNDYSTRELWCSAAEFASLWGAEVPVPQSFFKQHGMDLAGLEAVCPGITDDLTEAFGWEGIAQITDRPRIIAETPMAPVVHTICQTWDRALKRTVEALVDPEARSRAAYRAQQLHAALCDEADQQPPGATVADLYASLLPRLYEIVLGRSVSVDVTRTTELFRFSPETAVRPRFSILNAFLDPETRQAARDAYNEAMAHGQAYGLDAFGTGALPFEVVLPGRGRGTLRLGTAGGVIMTPDPVGFRFDRAPMDTVELAAILQRRFGDQVVLIGKAVTLIGMLAAEHVLVFHEGASAYTDRSVDLHRRLRELGWQTPLHPILRVHLNPMGSMGAIQADLHVPEPARRLWGETIAPAERWRELANQGQQAAKAELERDPVRRTEDLLERLQDDPAGRELKRRYHELQQKTQCLGTELQRLREQRHEAWAELAACTKAREAAEKASGDHWREYLLDQAATSNHLAERKRLQSEVDHAVSAQQAARKHLKKLQRDERELVFSTEAMALREARREHQFAVRLLTARRLKEAHYITEGLPAANRRPAAWWFPVLDESNEWYRQTMENAQYALESLT